ncbi:membrane protein [Neptunitalea chrysea]|uniref:Membrane protein n=2 Tax=Neptunitalea chrysea TaxID=1647581 RepID=A0A9W6ETY6_9FLAO|nr:membrane protein [Neptunitalea chrysea]
MVGKLISLLDNNFNFWHGFLFTRITNENLLAFSTKNHIMKIKFLAIIVIFLSINSTVSAQKSIRIGYVDMNYILQNVQEYQTANKQLNDKVLKWKKEMEKMQSEINSRRAELNAESVLLTKELIEEREEDISILEGELLDYQQQRFGPDGDLITQKKTLVQPIQDQVFNSVQEVGKGRKFDFVFDKSSDLMMLYADKKYDISDIVLMSINRAEKIQAREKALDEFDKQTNPALLEREKKLEEKRKLQEQKKAERQAAYEAKRQKLLEQREARIKAKEEALKAKQNKDNENTQSDEEE